MKALKIKETLCVALLLIFIFFVVGKAEGSEKSAAQLLESVSAQIQAENLDERDNNSFKKNFGLSAHEVDDFAYLSSDDIMNVNEILIVKLKQESDAQTVIDAIEAHVKSQRDIFNGYGEEQSELLRNCVIKHSGNCILFVVGKNAQQAEDAFTAAL